MNLAVSHSQLGGPGYFKVSEIGANSDVRAQVPKFKKWRTFVSGARHSDLHPRPLSLNTKIRLPTATEDLIVSQLLYHVHAFLLVHV